MRKPLSTTSFLRDGFRLLKQEAPNIHKTMLESLTGLVVNVRIGEEQFFITASRRGLRFVNDRWHTLAHAEGECSTAGLFGFVDGRNTLLQLIMTNEFKLKARAEVVLQLHHLLTLLLETSSRSVILHRHFESYRGWCLTRTAKSSQYLSY
jgi:hypothetical protein